MASVSNCDLCKAEGPKMLDDTICWAAFCRTHPSKLIVVLRRHARNPTDYELAHMMSQLRPMILYQNRRKWKFEGTTIPEHYHFHQI